MLKPLVHMLFHMHNRPPKLYTHLNEALLFCLICDTPIKNRGLSNDA
jgi:hypothetical protein